MGRDWAPLGCGPFPCGYWAMPADTSPAAGVSLPPSLILLLLLPSAASDHSFACGAGFAVFSGRRCCLRLPTPLGGPCRRRCGWATRSAATTAQPGVKFDGEGGNPAVFLRRTAIFLFCRISPSSAVYVDIHMCAFFCSRNIHLICFSRKKMVLWLYDCMQYLCSPSRIPLTIFGRCNYFSFFPFFSRFLTIFADQQEVCACEYTVSRFDCFTFFHSFLIISKNFVNRQKKTQVVLHIIFTYLYYHSRLLHYDTWGSSVNVNVPLK